MLCFERGGIDRRLDGPLGLGGFKGLSLRVVADDVNVDVAADVELLRPEHRHLGGWFCVYPADVVGGGASSLRCCVSFSNENSKSTSRISQRSNLPASQAPTVASRLAPDPAWSKPILPSGGQGVGGSLDPCTSANQAHGPSGSQTCTDHQISVYILLLAPKILVSLFLLFFFSSLCLLA